MKETTIKVINVSKSYKLYENPIDRVKETFLKNKCYHKEFFAVNDITFSVNRGETVGIIGRNGAGKSTLLKMITGVLTPTVGQIELSGNISALLELGTGFDAERNGIENIYLNGRINGLTKNEIDQSMGEILEFADIGDFIYQPIKTYSSGMLVRLAFAVAVNVKPEILIVDEALSVGDVRFQQKCYRKIREFKQNGTVLFVSHDTGAIASFCDRVIWLEDGKIYREGIPGDIIDEYLSYMRYETKRYSAFSDGEKDDTKTNNGHNGMNEDENNTFVHEFGNEAARFKKVSLTDNEGKIISYVTGEQEIMIKMDIEANKDIENPILGFNIKDLLGNELVVTNTVFENIKLEKFEKGKRYNFNWKFKFPCLHAGDYPVDIALAEGTYLNHEQIHFVSEALIIKCVDDRLYQEGRGRFILNNVELVKI